MEQTIDKQLQDPLKINQSSAKWKLVDTVCVYYEIFTKLILNYIVKLALVKSRLINKCIRNGKFTQKLYQEFLWKI